MGAGLITVAAAQNALFALTTTTTTKIPEDKTDMTDTIDITTKDI